MKRLCIFLFAAVLCAPDASAFCGFFVAKADGKLFNKSSQVIIVRDGNHSVISMSNDFKGDVKDFAMVVPVPVVLKRNDIKTISQDVFGNVDEYSAPRLAEYYDPDPCPRNINDGVELLYNENAMGAANSYSNAVTLTDAIEPPKVVIEARYEVDEYDILILSARESEALKVWLDENGYKLPPQAEEVLDPYIKSDMKFFVAKVNLDRHNATEAQLLSPLQIHFNSPKFMLPIRLGMANADGDQDLIIHAYTRKGRVECTNYRTVKMPNDIHVPEFVQEDFGPFYKATFDRMYKRQSGQAVFLEYAWDVSPTVNVKCDPCVGPPPLDEKLVTMGCDWLNDPNPTVFYTRMHVRYNRKNFPQDLFFQNTPNSERFQSRYVITHPPKGNFDCKEGQKYIKQLLIKRQEELHQYAILTGNDVSTKRLYVDKYRRHLDTGDTGYLPTDSGDLDEDSGSFGNGWVIWLLAGGGLALLLIGQYIKTGIRPKTDES